MLELKGICKQYKTGSLVQTALDQVDLSLRENEFVAILGPSGSGKTTLLNIIGGLDHYDQGELLINSISTKKYKSRDWDTYRNHSIGFVFQSYNLIPHQSILSNVELALTISGISKKERKQRALRALEQVGLGVQAHKRPNQLSGGQMQRVAIARALVNDPEILLADEPTGALDSETGVQVMELLKEVARERLVVMVTHNPELAAEYATRIVKLKDGKIASDSNPYDGSEVTSNKDIPITGQVDGKKTKANSPKKTKRTSMSFLTSLSLSFNNLRTKKGRTILTAFAGSIGIIGIALILSLSNGVNQYIEDIQKETMSSYPITLTEQTIDLSGMIEKAQAQEREKVTHDFNAIYSDNRKMEHISEMASSFSINNLKKFKSYLDNPDSEIHQYIGENGISYTYSSNFGLYTKDCNDTWVDLGDGASSASESSQAMSMQSMSQMMGGGQRILYGQLMTGKDGSFISPGILDSYELVYGELPDSYDEMVLILDSNNEIELSKLYRLGLLPFEEYEKLLSGEDETTDANQDIKDSSDDSITDSNESENGEVSQQEQKIEVKRLEYDAISKMDYYLLANCDRYQKNKKGLYKPLEDEEQLHQKLEASPKLKITAILRLKEDRDPLVSFTVGYTKELTDYMVDYTNQSEVVKAQESQPETDITTGKEFGNGSTNLFQMLYGTMNMDTSSYENNLSQFGVVDLDCPQSIGLYADSFEQKDHIAECIDAYNQTVDEVDQIVYTDYTALLMSSITTIVNTISYILIAFVGVALVVSSIMIGIITYISVLERTREIGILRAMGASKRNISQVFNAETMIIGLISGLMGIGITLVLLIPANMIIHHLAESDQVSASLPVGASLILVGLSVVLTWIGGLIPSKKAARRDPVTALRSE